MNKFFLVLATFFSTACFAFPLTVPQAAAFRHLGYSCGGIQESGYAKGFDKASNATGVVLLSTVCSSGGRGSHPTYHAVWVRAKWDLVGHFLGAATIATPKVDPTAVFNLSGYVESTIAPQPYVVANYTIDLQQP